jgi:hypothetical protein
MCTKNKNQANLLVKIALLVLSLNVAVMANTSAAPSTSGNIVRITQEKFVAAPQISGPVDGDDIAGRTVTGTSAPFATIRVQVDHSNNSTSSGAVCCNAFATQVTADNRGHWVADNLPLRFNTGSTSADTDFEISAVAVTSDGQESLASSVSVQHSPLYAHRKELVDADSRPAHTGKRHVM